jgi:hypothetical protein
MELIQLVWHRNRWLALSNTVMNIGVPQNGAKFLGQLTNYCRLEKKFINEAR